MSDNSFKETGQFTGRYEAYVCSMSALDPDPEVALTDLVRQVREKLLAGQPGC